MRSRRSRTIDYELLRTIECHARKFERGPRVTPIVWCVRITGAKQGSMVLGMEAGREAEPEEQNDGFRVSHERIEAAPFPFPPSSLDRPSCRSS